MDTSETYIKMCDCSEIQELWEPRNMDRFAEPAREYDEFPYYTYTISSTGHFRRLLYYLISEVDGPFSYELYSIVTFERSPSYIWLPRQDDLQEMFKGVHGLYDEPYIATNDFYNFIRSFVYPIKMFKTMEQLWLAYYMYEKYKKTWSFKDHVWR